MPDPILVAGLAGGGAGLWVLWLWPALVAWLTALAEARAYAPRHAHRATDHLDTPWLFTTWTEIDLDRFEVGM